MLVTLAPSDPADPAQPAAPPGLWRIALHKTGGPALVAPVACRIHRDNDPYGYARGGRQSWFDDPRKNCSERMARFARIENPPGIFVRRFGTLNGIATHDKVVVVAGYEGGSERAATFSSAGPMRLPGHAGPGDVLISEMSDESPARPACWEPERAAARSSVSRAPAWPLRRRRASLRSSAPFCPRSFPAASAPAPVATGSGRMARAARRPPLGRTDVSASRSHRLPACFDTIQNSSQLSIRLGP